MNCSYDCKCDHANIADHVNIAVIYSCKLHLSINYLEEDIQASLL